MVLPGRNSRRRPSRQSIDILRGCGMPETPHLAPDPNEIRRALQLLFQRGDIVELRVPKAGRDGTISGYFDNADLLLTSALNIDGKAAATYVTLNPVDPALLARSANRVR